jgi:hypothetical protein
MIDCAMKTLKGAWLAQDSNKTGFGIQKHPPNTALNQKNRKKLFSPKRRYLIEGCYGRF